MGRRKNLSPADCYGALIKMMKDNPDLAEELVEDHGRAKRLGGELPATAYRIRTSMENDVAKFVGDKCAKHIHYFLEEMYHGEAAKGEG